MSFLDQPILFLDCQTTGTVAARDHLLELAWANSSASSSFPPAVESGLLRPPVPLPAVVTEMTGIREEDFRESEETSSLFARFRENLQPDTLLLAHYAQFERPFLEKFFREHETIAPEILCSYRIAKRLFPEAPSGNIRGLAGYLGYDLGEIRRSRDHVLATVLIWQRIAAELHQLGVHDRDGLTVWLKGKPKTSSVRKNFQVDRLKRLQLPDSPGIYRMLGSKGEVLYVGKATSLKSRVNSYFRGGCRRDSRKLEMLARVRDIETETCGSPLEAALRENDEIKKLRPHYNRALKSRDQHLVYFSRDLLRASSLQNDEHPVGPFREKGALCQYHEWTKSWGQEGMAEFVYDSVTEEFAQEGFLLFCAQHSLDPALAPSLRGLLAWGMWQLRARLKLSALAAMELEETAEDEEQETLKTESSEDEKTEEAEDEEIPAPERVASALSQLVQGAAADYRRAKSLSRLVNCQVRWTDSAGAARELVFSSAALAASPAKLDAGSTAHPWVGLGVADYDRMSVLHSELKKGNYLVESGGPGK